MPAADDRSGGPDDRAEARQVDRFQDDLHDPLLRGLLEHAEAMVTVKDVRGGFLLVNPAFAHALGREPEELVGLTAADVVPAALAAEWAEHDRQVVASGASLQVPERFPGAQGKVIDCITTKFPLVGHDGRVIALGSLRVPVGDLHQARDALEESEGRYRTLFEQAGVGQVEVDLTARLVAINATAATLFGHEQVPRPGRALGEVVRAADGDRLHEDLHRVLAGTAGGHHGRHTLVRRDGQPAAVHVTAAPVHGVDGTLRGALVTVVDVSDQERAEDQLRWSEQRSRSLLQGMPDAVIVLDDAGHIREVNERAGAVFGYRPEELIGRLVEDLVPARTRVPHEQLRASYTGGGHPAPMSTGPNVRGVRRDGSEVPLEINLASVVLEEGPAVIATVRDVTATRRLQERLLLGQQRQHALLQGMPDAVVVVDATGHIREVNRQCEALFGYRAEELVGRAVEDLVPVGQRGAHAQRRSAYVAREDPEPMSTGSGLVGVHRDGSEVPVEISLAGVTLDDGPAVIATVRDVSATRALQQQVRDSEELFRQAFDRAPTGMLLTSLRPQSLGRIIMANASFAALVGRERDELLGAETAGVLHPLDAGRSREALDTLSRGDAHAWNSERRLVHPDGRQVWARLSTSVVHAGDGTPLYAITQAEDVTDRRRAEKELVHQALHDALTGLPNRALLLDHLSQALARTARHHDQRVAVLYLDLDNFKDVNDALGHAAGDELLVECASRLRANLRDTDTAARLGGDEFVVVCEDIAGPEEAAHVAARIEAALGIDVPVREQSIRITASIGIAVGGSGDSAADLLRAADTAMYDAKRAGRGRYALVDPAAQARALRQVSLAADLRRALERSDERGDERRAGRRDAPRGELVLHYQPAYDARTGAVRAVEALLRWNHPEHGLLGPDRFLDVAEDRELMVPLGSWVLRAACRQAATWQDRLGRRAPEVWVNVSSRQLGRADLTSLVAEVTSETSLDPDRLCLEITERQVVQIDDAVQQDLNGVMRLGCHIAIDDFGTGHNDMSALRALPFDALKVDRSYVTGLGTDRTATAITTSVIALAKALGLQVVAEGVEVSEQVDRLRELDCDLLQGYLLHRPAPGHVIDLLLAEDSVPPALRTP